MKGAMCGVHTPSCGAHSRCALWRCRVASLKVLSSLGRHLRTTGSKLKEKKNPLASPQTGLSKWFVALAHSYHGIYLREYLLRTWL